MQSTTEATIRALSSLTRRDAASVRATVHAAAAGHSVQEHDDYDGYLSLLVTPADDAHPAYMVAGRTGAVDVAELRGDEMVALGTFPSIGAAMLVLRPALEHASWAGSTTPAPSTVVARLVDRHGADADLHAAMGADAGGNTGSWPHVLRALDDLGLAT